MVALLLVLVPDAIRSEVIGIVFASCLNDVFVNAEGREFERKRACNREGYKSREVQGS